MLLWRRFREGDDDGSASLEFITTGVLLLVPVTYLIVALSAIQSGAFAADGAARQAARVFVVSRSLPEATAAAEQAVRFSLADHGLADQPFDLLVTCRPTPDECFTRRGTVTVSVRTSVPLPLIPSALRLDAPARVSLESTSTQVVSRFWSAR